MTSPIEEILIGLLAEFPATAVSLRVTLAFAYPGDESDRDD